MHSLKAAGPCSLFKYLLGNISAIHICGGGVYLQQHVESKINCNTPVCSNEGTFHPVPTACTCLVSGPVVGYGHLLLSFCDRKINRECQASLN